MVARAKEHARREGVGERIKEQAAQLGFNLKDEAKALKQQATQKAEELTKTAKEEAERFLNHQKSRAAEQIEKIGSVVHQAARVLEAGSVGKVAGYVDMAATGATEASRYLEESDLGEIAEDVAKTVRRHPLAACTAMIVAGLAVARFVKAGQAESGDESSRESRGSERKRRG